MYCIDYEHEKDVRIPNNIMKYESVYNNILNVICCER